MICQICKSTKIYSLFQRIAANTQLGEVILWIGGDNLLRPKTNYGLDLAVARWNRG
jgi:hypothetical protein